MRFISTTLTQFSRTIKPDFLVIRNLVVGVNGHDYRNLLYGFMHANIPCVNSLESIYAFLERPVVYGALKKIQQKLGKENFPLIEQTFYPKYSEMKYAMDKYASNFKL